jgi:uncharacterized membrane protein
MYARRPLRKRSPAPDGSPGVPRWPAVIALLAIGAIYYVVPARLRIGPRWGLLALDVAFAIALYVLRRFGMHIATRRVAIGATVIVTLALTTSAVSLVVRLPSGTETAPQLLRGGGLIWILNILVFAIWYWEIDGGGPGKRQIGHHASTDFVFPQMAFDDEESMTWSPSFFDYLFLAFNTSTAFSPTDTLVLSRLAKILMMCQSLLSLLVISVIVARAINTLTT